MSDPLDRLTQNRDQERYHELRRARRNPKKNDAARAIFPLAKNELAEVAIKVTRTRPSRLAKDSTVSSSAPGWISRTQWISIPAVRPFRRQARGHSHSQGTSTWLKPTTGRRVRPSAVPLHRPRPPGCLAFQLLRIVGKDLLVAPAVGEKFHEKLDGKPRTLDDRFAGQHRRIDANPFHVVCISYGKLLENHCLISVAAPRARSCLTKLDLPLWRVRISLSRR